MATIVGVRCDCCGKPCAKTLRKYNEAVKLGQRMTCSRECWVKIKVTSETRYCNHCGSPIVVAASVIRRSTTGRFYCNNSCSASESNSARVVSEDTKLKTSASLSRHAEETGHSRKRVCACCGKEYHWKNRDVPWCSPECRHAILGQRGILSPVDTLAAIVGMSNGVDAPSSKHDLAVRCSAIVHFGSWNQAILAAGMRPSSSTMRRRRIRCADGHMADSIGERVVDDWLHSCGIEHHRHVRYPEGKYTCDFYLPVGKLYVEYLGLTGVPQYDETTRVKEAIARRHGLAWRPVWPSDLFPECRLRRSSYVPDDEPQDGSCERFDERNDQMRKGKPTG